VSTPPTLNDPDDGERYKAGMLTFATLGPEGSNHHFVLQQYLQAHRLTGAAAMRMVDDFHAGARAVLAGEADYLLQCAAHPATAEITGRYRTRMAVVDAFVSPSRPMALVQTRSTAADGGRVGVQPATQSYANLARWPEVVHEPTVMTVQDGLRQGRYDAGIVFTSFALAHADVFQVVETIGTVCDAWILYGKEAVDHGEAVVWRDSPVARQYWLALNRQPPSCDA
jgi:hypothetical protein